MHRQVYVITVILLGLAGYVWGGTLAVSAQMPGGEMPPTPVAVMTMMTETVPKVVELPGRVAATREAQIRPQVSGLVTERMFEEGATVEKGQQLFQIDDARYVAAFNAAKADLESAKAGVKSAEARADRYKELVKIGAVSKQEYDDADAGKAAAVAAVAVAEAAVETARVNLGYTKVFAPISGRIGRALVTEGALVGAGQEQSLAVIVQLDPVYVDLQQSGAEAVSLRETMKDEGSVPVVIDAGAGPYPHKGRLKFSEVTVDEATGSVTLRALVPNPDGVLLPGLFARAALELGGSEALLVPQRAATRNPDGSLSVWVVDKDNNASPRPIQVAGAFHDSWIVSGGLAAGETVVTEGYQKLQPGAPVAPEGKTEQEP